jgi:hypothetical protein
MVKACFILDVVEKLDKEIEDLREEVGDKVNEVIEIMKGNEYVRQLVN